MGDIAPYMRPDFDFDLAMKAAKGLNEFANKVEVELSAVAETRDSALATWSGPWGDEFRKRASDEDQNRAP